MTNDLSITNNSIMNVTIVRNEINNLSTDGTHHIFQAITHAKRCRCSKAKTLRIRSRNNNQLRDFFASDKLAVLKLVNLKRSIEIHFSRSKFIVLASRLPDYEIGHISILEGTNRKLILRILTY